MNNKIDSIIYYSVALKGFEELDFKDDALAGVRACYFSSGFETQQDDTIRQFEQAKFNYCYCLEQDKPMLWKVFKNQMLIQASKYLPDNLYCICFYNSAEIVTKKVYFNHKHYWTKTEYFAPENGVDVLCSIAPKIINGYFALIKTIYDESGCVASPLYMVRSTPSVEACDAVAYTDKGMLYFTPQTPVGVSNEKPEKRGFTFTPNDFNLARNLNSTFDISFAPYLTEENGKPVDKEVKTREKDFDFSQSIFSHSNSVDENKDATSENKDTVAETSSSENKNTITKIYSDEFDNYSENNNSETEIKSTKTLFSSDTKSSQSSDLIGETTEEIQPNLEFSEDEDINIYHSEDFSVKNGDYNISDKPTPNKVIDDGESKFTYYGSLDENGNRSGYGRTETPMGKTAYEGQYKDDMRNGFGSFYYKDGAINYVGDWTENKRDGRGVGFRSTDGEIHVGKWKDNAPENMGARFDKDGNFISINNFVHGIKDGVGISFDEKGNLVISKWVNNHEISSKIILLGEDNANRKDN